MSDSQTPEQRIWAQVYERFDPEQPAFKREWYLPHPLLLKAKLPKPAG